MIRLILLVIIFVLYRNYSRFTNQSKKQSNSNWLLNLLTDLHIKSTLATKKAQPFLNATEPDYYRLGFVARHAWLFKRVLEA